MQQSSSQQKFDVIVVLENGEERTIQQTGSNLEVAMRRALKFTPGAVEVKKPVT